jgi:hypothetical protein
MAGESSSEKIYRSRYIPRMFHLELEPIREFKTASKSRWRTADRDEVSSRTYGGPVPETNAPR